MIKQEALVKLAQVRLAINYVLRTRGIEKRGGFPDYTGMNTSLNSQFKTYSNPTNLGMSVGRSLPGLFNGLGNIPRTVSNWFRGLNGTQQNPSPPSIVSNTAGQNSATNNNQPVQTDSNFATGTNSSSGWGSLWSEYDQYKQMSPEEKQDYWGRFDREAERSWNRGRIARNEQSVRNSVINWYGLNPIEQYELRQRGITPESIELEQQWNRARSRYGY